MAPAICPISNELSERESTTRIASPLSRRSLSSSGEMRGTSLLIVGAWPTVGIGVGVGGSGVAVGVVVGVGVGAGGSGVAVGVVVGAGVGAGGSGVAVGATDTDETPQEIRSDVTSIKQEL
jgi:hypothetical protein